MIKFKELDKYAELNPIRDHISLHFKVVEEDYELPEILKDISETFKADVSRVIVFCSSRRLTEDSTNSCNNFFSKNEQLKGKAAYYHAGMDSDSRNRIFKGYNEGKYQILFATKAFGMGMDIPNIHHVYHLEPSSSFEDYLQEVGRAGRNRTMLESAGFSEDKPIKATCVYNSDSFAKKVDWIQKTQASWNDMCNAYEIYLNFRKKFISDNSKSEVLEYLPVPISILGISNKYQASEIDLGGLYRLSLYWLEKASRITSRYNVPAYLEFKNEPYLNNEIASDIVNEKHKKILQHIYHVKKANFDSEESTLVEGNELFRIAELESRDLLFSMVVDMQEKGLVELINKVNLDLTDSGNNEINRLKYVKSKLNIEIQLQFLKGIEQLGHRLIDSVIPFEETEFDLDYLTSLSREIQQEVFIDKFFASLLINENNEKGIREYLTKKRDFWSNSAKEVRAKIRSTDPELFEILQYQRNIIIDNQFSNKLKSIFQILSSHEAVRITSRFSEDKDEIIQAISITENRQVIKDYLSQLVSDAAQLFKVLSDWGSRVVDVNKLILKLNIKNRSYKYVDLLITILRKMGYTKMFGSLIPMAIEMKFKQLDPLNNLDGDSEVKEQYVETIRMKKLRLCVLNAFSDIEDKTLQNDFILDYFKSSTSSEVIELIEQKSTTERAEEILRSYRADALEVLVKGDDNGKGNPGLNEHQKAVYDADIRKNLSVIAGPGTGKTHTLVLRVARLIQQESITPASILVLAYNRSVAEELRIRLKELFVKLGYKSLINSLQIYTFHGLMGAVLKENGKDVELSKWEDEFIKLYKSEGRRCLRKFEKVEYVFVDEFQDITQKRLEILKYVAPKERSFLTVIGDPNQSIYGYERVDQGGSRSPAQYYSEFDEEYSPVHKYLEVNYRSTNKIIESSKNILGDQLGKIKIEPFKKGDSDSVFEIDTTKDWLNELVSLLRKDDINETAVLYRTNEELYKDYFKLKYLGEKLNIKVEIKGSTNQFASSREVSRILEVLLDKKGGEEISKEFIVNNVINKVKGLYPNWDVNLLDNLYLIFEYFYDLYGSRVTYSEFAHFVSDITSRDDGQLFSVLSKKSGKNTKKLFLTTIHRVKGLEYDAVVVPSSIAKLPFDTKNQEYSEQEYRDIIEEEKRLLYVAYSRAKKYLVIQTGPRELAIRDYGYYEISELDKSSGIPVKNEFGQVFLSWKAKEWCFSKLQNLIHEKLVTGSELHLGRDRFNKVCVKFGNHEIEQFTDKSSSKFDAISYSGIYLDSIIRYTYDQCISYDEKNRTNYSQIWCKDAVSQGYIYSVSFYGYAKESSKWLKDKEHMERNIDRLVDGLESVAKDDLSTYINHGKRYTDEEIEDLKRTYINCASVEICSEKFKRKPSSIASKLKWLGILNDPEWISKLEKYD